MRLITVRPGDKPRRKSHRLALLIALIITLICGLGVFVYLRPLPSPRLSINLPPAPATNNAEVAWPAIGQAAFSANGYDFIAESSPPQTISTASIAKVITVLTVLQKHPLNLNEQGDTITITAADIALLQKEINQNGTHLDVVEGEKLTEYQAIQAIMLPSANNIANTLAIWAYGSIDNYLVAANQFLKDNGLSQTHVEGDASGYDPRTVSTTRDLIKLAKLAQDQPVVMDVAGQKSATFQTAGTVYNHNNKIGDGIITGLKTGRNDGNSGSVLFTANIGEGNDTVRLAGIVADAGTLQNALDSAESLAKGLQNDFPTTVYVKKGEVVGSLQTDWGHETTVVAAQTASIKHWTNDKIYVNEVKPTRASFDSTAPVGQIVLRSSGRKTTTDLKLSSPIAAPSVWWRISHWR